MEQGSGVNVDTGFLLSGEVNLPIPELSLLALILLVVLILLPYAKSEDR
jgi:hypothetical protein